MSQIIRACDAHPNVRSAFRIFRDAKRLAGDHFNAGPFVGWLGEIIVEHEFPGMRRAPFGNAGYDFTDRKGRRVQVKAWGSGKRSHDNLRDLSKVDRFIRVRIYDYGYEVVTDMLTKDHGTLGGLVVMRNGNTRPLGAQYANPKISAGAKQAWVTMRARAA